MENTNLDKELQLSSLPDDCLECIFFQLPDLNSQIQVSKVCHRFQAIIYERLWRRGALYQCLCYDEWLEFDLSFEDFAYFLNIVCDAIKEIKLISYHLHDFLKEVRELNIDCFPQVRCFDTENVTDLFAIDNEVQSLAKLLPNVQILRLTQALTGRHLKQFRQLAELHLYHNYEKDYELKNQYLQELLENATQLRVLDIRSYEMSNLDIDSIDRCQNLQVLRLNLNVLKPALDKVLALKQLRTLTVMLDNVIDVSRIDNVDTYDYKIYETAEFYYILQNRAERITGIAVDNYYMPLTANWDANLDISKHNKLTKFAFCNYEHDDEMLEKYVAMKELRLLCCRNWSKLTNGTLLKMVAACTKLKHLDITYCMCINDDFVQGTYRILKAQKARKYALTIYYAMTSIDIENVAKLPANWQSLMIFSADLPPESDQGLSFVQRGFEFDFA